MPSSQMMYPIESIPVKSGAGVKMISFSSIITVPLVGNKVLSILTVSTPLSGSISLDNTSIVAMSLEVIISESVTAIG